MNSPSIDPKNTPLANTSLGAFPQLPLNDPSPPPLSSHAVNTIQSSNKQAIPPPMEEDRVSLVKMGEFIVQELDELLNVKAACIEEELEHLEDTEENKEIVRGILNEREAPFSPVNINNEKVKEGGQYLDTFLPKELLAGIPEEEKIETMDRIANLGVTFLKALETNSDVLVLICRAKIVQESKQLLEKYRDRFGREPPLPKTIKHLGKALADAEIHALSVDDVKKVENKLREINKTKWSGRILAEERALQREKTGKKLSYFSSGYMLAEFLPAYLPSSSVMAAVTVVSSAGLVSSILGFIVAGIKMGQVADESSELNRWILSYHKFQSKQENKTQIDAAAHMSQSLLEKREAIVGKKILLLTPHFTSIKEKIKEIHERRFKNDMRRLLSETLKENRSCSYGEVTEILAKWGMLEDRLLDRTLLGALLLCKPMNENEPSRIPENLKKELAGALEKWMSDPKEMGEQFTFWFLRQEERVLLKSYIDHQETIEQTTKNALHQMVKQKHEMETAFFRLKKTKSELHFVIALSTLAISITLIVLLALSIPFGGIFFVFLGIAVGSLLINLGLLGQATYLLSKYKSDRLAPINLWSGMKKKWIELRSSIASYKLDSKKEELVCIAMALNEMRLRKENGEADKRRYEIGLQKFKEAKASFARKKERVDSWEKKMNEIDHSILERKWRGFSKYASLQTDNGSFGTIEAFQEAFKQCDFSLLSDETKKLLEQHLGIDLKAFASQLAKQPEETRKMLQQFFLLEDSSFVSFIRKQQA